MEIVLATRNKKKAEEISRLLYSSNISIYTLNDFPQCPEVEEDQNTFEGNAVKKAKEIAACTGLAAMADDSGIVVDALGGRPGVMSARYAGDGATDRDNVVKLLQEMEGVADTGRGARFVCCIAFGTPGGEVTTFMGTVEGTLGRTPLGQNGFGYDPLFFPEGHDRTFAQMSAAEKDALSHRSRALTLFTQFINDLKLKGNRCASAATH